MRKNINLCLNYHDFSETNAKTWKNSNYTIDFNSFKKQLDLLSDLQNITLVSLLADIPTISFCLTFDDGYKSNLYIAEELLKRTLKGTFFIIKDRTNLNSNFLNVSDIKEMNNMGMEFGSHSCTHRHLNRLNINDLIAEFRISKSYIEDIIAKPIYSIAYPGGHFGPREIKISNSEGYLLNRTSLSGLNHYPLKNGIVKCISIKREFDLHKFKSIIDISPLCFAKIKLRELALSFPKFIESKIVSSKY